MWLRPKFQSCDPGPPSPSNFSSSGWRKRALSWALLFPPPPLPTLASFPWNASWINYMLMSLLQQKVRRGCDNVLGQSRLPDLGEAAVSSGVKRDLNSLPRNWTWVAWMKTRNPSHQTPWLLPALKNTFLTEAKTVKTSTNFIIRDIAQQVGEHIEKQFV